MPLSDPARDRAECFADSDDAGRVLVWNIARRVRNHAGQWSDLPAVRVTREDKIKPE